MTALFIIVCFVMFFVVGGAFLLGAIKLAAKLFLFFFGLFLFGALFGFSFMFSVLLNPWLCILIFVGIAIFAGRKQIFRREEAKVIIIEK